MAVKNSLVAAGVFPTKALVQKKLAQSIATMQAVLADAASVDTLVRLAENTTSSLKSGGKLLVAGNGGSAADAQHLVCEFVGRLTASHPALGAIALTTDTSILTAVSNYFSFDDVFARQVEALGDPGDVFLGISTSGNSLSIVKAAELAARSSSPESASWATTRTPLRPQPRHPLAVTMNIQECHLALEHIFCMLVELCYFSPDFASRPHRLAE